MIDDLESEDLRIPERDLLLRRLQRSRGTGGRQISTLTKLNQRGPVKQRSMRIYLRTTLIAKPKKVMQAIGFQACARADTLPGDNLTRRP